METESWNEVFDRMMQPDLLTPQQFAELTHGTVEGPGEQKLMLAVLIDAIRCWQLRPLAEVEVEAYTTRATEYASVHTRKPMLMAVEAHLWIFAPGGTAVFAFDNVCEVLGYEPDLFREQLHRWRGGNGSIPRIRSLAVGRAYEKMSQNRVMRRFRGRAAQKRREAVAKATGAVSGPAQAIPESLDGQLAPAAG